MIGEGMKVQFVPAFLESKVLTPEERRDFTHTGTVTYINWEHRMFWVEFEAGGTKQREAFQFYDIGKQVKVIG